MYSKKLNKANLLFILLIPCLSLQAQVLPTSLIDTELRKYADAHIQNHETIITIVDESKAIVNENYTITIFDDDESIHQLFTIFPFDDFQKINSLRMEIFNAQGGSVKRIKKNDFMDAASNGSSTLYSDNRILGYDISEMEAPYTFTVSVETELQQLMALASWIPIPAQNISLKSAGLTIIHKGNMEIKYLNQMAGKPTITNLPTGKKYNWQIQDIPAIHNLSYYDENLLNVIPRVRWVPTKFEFGGVSGSFESWQEFSKWLDNLSLTTRELPTGAKKEINTLIDEGMSDVEKIKTIYGYLQERSRYVSIQLGVGGFKPFDAAVVHESQYGDCKALSNYTQSLLKEVGIESHYATIFAGRRSRHTVDPSFPSNSFNHAVLLVPINQDTVLLECTSQDLPCGFRSRFTDGRYAMIVNEKKGKLIKTPMYTLEDNQQIDSIRLSLSIDGTTTLQGKSRMTGIQADQFHILEYPSSDQKKWLVDHIDFGQFDIVNYSMAENAFDDWSYDMTISTELVSTNYANKSGNRIFITPGIYHTFGNKSMRDSMQYCFQIDRPYQYKTHVTMGIPANYELESSLDDHLIVHEFGSYSISYKMDQENKRLIIDRKYTIHNGKHPKEVYLTFKEFKKAIYKLEREDIVFVKSP